MTRKRQDSYNKFDQAHFVKLTKRRFKKKFGKEISATEINKIWKDYVQYRIIQNVLKGDCVKIDKHSTIQVVGMPVVNDQNLVSLLSNGKIMRRDGTISKADLSHKRKYYKYKIVYKNKLAKGTLIFKASPMFKKQLVDTLNNTNIYFTIKSQIRDETIRI